MLYFAIFLIPLFLMFLYATVKMINQYERGVFFRMGKITKTKEPGIAFVLPLLERMEKVDTRTITHDVPGQDIITKDNVSVKVNAVVYFRVLEPLKAVVEVENFLFATSQMAQTTLRSILGQSELDELLTGREKINHELQIILLTGLHLQNSSNSPHTSYCLASFILLLV